MRKNEPELTSEQQLTLGRFLRVSSVRSWQNGVLPRHTAKDDGNAEVGNTFRLSSSPYFNTSHLTTVFSHKQASVITLVQTDQAARTINHKIRRPPGTQLYTFIHRLNWRQEAALMGCMELFEPFKRLWELPFTGKITFGRNWPLSCTILYL